MKKREKLVSKNSARYPGDFITSAPNTGAWPMIRDDHGGPLIQEQALYDLLRGDHANDLDTKI